MHVNKHNKDPVLEFSELAEGTSYTLHMELVPNLHSGQFPL